MRFVAFSLLTGLLTAGLVAGERQGGGQASAYVEIDGSKNAQDVPAWLAWEIGLRMVALASTPPSGLLDSLGLSQADKDVIVEAAKDQVKRDETCQQRVEKLRPLLAREEWDRINQKTQAIQLECRQATLDSGDALLGRLSPEGQAAFVTWIETQKSGIRVRVPEAELEHYRRPH